MLAWHIAAIQNYSPNLNPISFLEPEFPSRRLGHSLQLEWKWLNPDLTRKHYSQIQGWWTGGTDGWRLTWGWKQVLTLPYFLSPTHWCGKPGKKRSQITLLVALFSSFVSDRTNGKESTRAVLGGKISHWLSILENPNGGGSREKGLRVPVMNKR